MNFFKKIDQYLLHNFPSIWVTRVHSFLPIGLGLALLLFLGNISIGWNPKNDLPESEWPILLMIIPITIYLVYWFIFQSRYNVVKSGGKESYGKNYLNFLLYTAVFGVAFLLIIAIPFSNDYKVAHSSSADEIKQDISNLNKGSGLINYPEYTETLSNGRIKVAIIDFVNDYYYYSEYPNPNHEIISKKEALQRIENFIFSYNKFNENEIFESPEMILEDQIHINETNYDNSDEAYMKAAFFYGDYNGDWVMSKKINLINHWHEGNKYIIWNEPWFWKIAIGFTLIFALFVWVFKQMRLRHFIFGFISLCLLPIVIAIFTAVVYGLFYDYYGIGNPIDRFMALLGLLFFIVIAFISIRGYLQNKLNQTAYVVTMIFNLSLLLFPLFFYFFIITMRADNNFYNLSNRDILGIEPQEFIYWSTVIVGLATIAIFKPMYDKFRSLPTRK